MVLACIALALTAGITAYLTLPKEGAPDIEIPAFFVSVVFPGISAEDSESLIVRPLEAKLSQVDGLEDIFGSAADGYAGLSLNFEFGLDKAKTLADIRELVDQAEAEFPDGAEDATITEFSLADTPIIVVVLSGEISERVLIQVGEQIKDRLESLPEVLEVGFTGQRAEMVEVIIDPLHLDAYNVTADELIRVVTRNNQLVAAGEVETEQGSFSIRIPASFDDQWDVERLPVKTDGYRVVTLGDVSDVRMTFQDREGFARHNSEPTVAIQVVKRRDANIIDTAALVRKTVTEVQNTWPEPLQDAVKVEFAQDVSHQVFDMVTQLESSVLTAIALVMIVVLAALGTRSALLVGFAIPTSFLLCFALLALMSISISNIVMFGLILAVGMLVDSAIVVVELADRRMKEGRRPMDAFADAAKRMFWPIISSTATTLCAFLPMLFWPGVAGQFMGTLPVTIIFVLSASLLVALIFLPVVGGVSGAISQRIELLSRRLSRIHLILRLILLLAVAALTGAAVLLILNPALIGLQTPAAGSFTASIPGAVLFVFGALSLSVTVGSIRAPRRRQKITAAWKRSPFGWVMHFVVGNPIMPVLCVAAAATAVTLAVRSYSQNNYGVEFFVDAEPEQVQIFVRARGNLSLIEKDLLVREVESSIVGLDGVASVFATTGASGLRDESGGSRPLDTIGVIQIEFDRWETRQLIGGVATDTRKITELVETRLSELPGIRTDLQELAQGPNQGKPVSLRLTSKDWNALLDATSVVRDRFDRVEGLVFIEDTRPLPGIDWKIDVDLEEAGRYGTDITTIGAMVQMLTRGILLGTMRVDSSDEEIDIRVRFPEEDRHLSTLDSLRVRSQSGLVPISNFVSRTPVAKIGQVSRFNQVRHIDVRADVESGLSNADGRPITPTERIGVITEWLENDSALPAGVNWQWTGDQEEQAESQRFLMQAFIGALGLMFTVLLAQFNSFYNAVLVLLAVILSTVGALLGLLILQQPFSIIMTGVGIVALAGIVVNNNIMLIDTYKEYSKIMPKLEAIVRTTEVRARPVLLTSITTIAGLLPMMFGFAINIVQGGYVVDTPSSLWWKQLASAVVFGLGTATVLTLFVTPSLLAIPIWARKGSYGLFRRAVALVGGRDSFVARDLNLNSSLRRHPGETIFWDTHLAGAETSLPAEELNPFPDATQLEFADSGSESLPPDREHEKEPKTGLTDAELQAAE